MARDFLLGPDGDLATANGDLVAGDSDLQEQELLLLLSKGSIKQFPIAGVGAINYLQSEDPTGLLREIRGQFSEDGRNVKQVGYDKDGKLIIDAPYK